MMWGRSNLYIDLILSRDHVTRVAFEIGTLLHGEFGNQYALYRFVSRGGNGTLFEVLPYTESRPWLEASPDEKRVAKILHNQQPPRPTRFENEIKILQMLEHPNIVSLCDYGVFSHQCGYEFPFYVTNLADSDVKREVIEHGPYTGEKCAMLFLEACDAFELVHRMGVVHRDVKPANFLFVEGKIKVCDFGLAKVHDQDNVGPYFFKDVTMITEHVGPIYFLSPELVRYSMFDKSYDVDHRSDIFQLGKVFWMMLTGDIPQGRITRKGNPDIDAFFPIIDKMLLDDRDLRYQSATEVYLAILDVVTQL